MTWLRSRLHSAHSTRLALGVLAVGSVVVAIVLLSSVALSGRPSARAAASAPPAATAPPGAASPPAAPTSQPATPTAPPVTATPAARPPALRQHTVQPGETVRQLAERYGLQPATLIAANRLEQPDHLVPGQALTIPAKDGVVHRVADGESLRQLAERYGVDLAEIIAANHLGEQPDLIQPDTLLLIPGAEPGPPGAGAGGGSAEAAAPPQRVSAEPPPAVTAAHIAILDEASGELLFGQGANERVAPASTTKIATTLVALEQGGDLEQRIDVTVSGSAMNARDGSSIMGLEPGREVSLRTLLYGLMLPSGNDAAEQVALALAGSRERYVGWMNDLVGVMGLRDTHFANPSGMDARDHYSSAYDMAKLARRAMANETFRTLAGAASYQGDGYVLKNLNRLIGAYPGADGVKIGYTRAAGRTIVASATRDGHRVYVSLMRSSDLPGDSTALFDWVWQTFRWQ